MAARPTAGRADLVRRHAQGFGYIRKDLSEARPVNLVISLKEQRARR